MERQIKEYEKFIAHASKRPTPALAQYHREMIANFQHERFIHLLVTLFFAALTIAAVTCTILLTFSCLGAWEILMPLYLLCAILFVVTLFYIKHYYFLENHIQNLYNYSRKLNSALNERKHGSD